MVLETVTPERAKELLGVNAVKRNLRGRVVNTYAEDMRRGDWKLTGEAVAIDPRGNLINGQHRMTACVVADRSFTTWVAYNVDPATQSVADTGTRRQLKDTLTERGEANTHILAAILRLEVTRRVDPDMRSSQYVPSHSELLRLFDESPDLWRDAARTGIAAERALHLASASLLGYAWKLLASADDEDAYEDAEAFFEKLKFADGIGRGDPVYALRRVLGNMAGFGTLAERRKTLALTVKAWNAFRDGVELQQLHFKSGGRFAESMPEPR